MLSGHEFCVRLLADYVAQFDKSIWGELSRNLSWIWAIGVDLLVVFGLLVGFLLHRVFDDFSKRKGGLWVVFLFFRHLGCDEDDDQHDETKASIDVDVLCAWVL